jgi:hypothetical protein
VEVGAGEGIGEGKLDTPTFVSRGMDESVPPRIGFRTSILHEENTLRKIKPQIKFLVFMGPISLSYHCQKK